MSHHQPWYPDGVFWTSWDDYRQRCNRIDVIRRYFKSQHATRHIDFNSLHDIASVGIAEGDLDDVLLSLCPNVKEYDGIEPYQDRCSMAQRRLETAYPSVNISCLGRNFEDYQREPESVDAIFLMHCLYSFKDSLVDTLRQALSMVKVGGKAVIMINHGQLLQNMGSVKSDMANQLLQQIRDAVDELGLKYTEEETEPFLIDMSDEGEGYYDMVNLGSWHKITNQEKDDILQNIMTAALPGTNKIPYQHTVFIIYKETQNSSKNGHDSKYCTIV